MAFFSKLKERLFKSSSKIDEGLDAIVEEGGVEEEAQGAEATEHAPEPAVEEAPPSLDEADVPGRTPSEDAFEVPVEEARDAGSEAPDQVRGMDADGGEAADQVRGYEARDLAGGEAEAPDQVRGISGRAGDSDAPAGEPGPQRVEARESEPALEPVPSEPPRPLETSAPQSAKPGILGRLFRGEQKTVVRRELDDNMLEQIEDLLITADMGVDTAARVTANMAEGRFGRRFSTDELKEIMAGEIARIMEPVARPMPLYQKRPQVVLVVGVNGSGKTTTIGKLASQFRAAGKSVVIAAGDTFRAAAVEQLQVWGERAGVPVLTAPEGSDPASLAFDAHVQAERDGADLLMIDTAGRLQNRADLMEELAKIVRVIRKRDPDAPHNTLLVLDATTGQNALNQVEIFQKIADVSGLVMTKLDGTAKGGVLVALADRFGLPIHAIGVGEQIDDLQPFDPREFAAALTGLEA